MTSVTKLTLMVIGAAGVLLLAGGFPLMGAPDVYRGGAMLLVGIAATLLCAVGGWRLAAGQRGRFICGLTALFFAGAGLCAVVSFGCEAVSMAAVGGAMWFGAVGMGCTAAVGALLTAIFGFFTLRLMNARLWLAGIHWSLVLLAVGAYTDYCCELRVPLTLPVGINHTVRSVPTPEGDCALPFALTPEKASLTRYDTETGYTLYRYESGRWHIIGPLLRQGDMLCFGNEQWPVASVRSAPGIAQPFLAVKGEGVPRLIMRDLPPVKEYRADCRIETTYRGRAEERRQVLRVNEPICCKGWVVSLMNYRDTPRGTQLDLLFRRAPGRLPARTGMVGLILCTAFSCWGYRRRNKTVS